MRQENRKEIRMVNEKRLKKVISNEIEIYAITQAEVSRVVDEGKISCYDKSQLTNLIYSKIAKNYNFQ